MAMIPENPVVGGTVLRRAAIQSPNFVSGSTGWTVRQDGSAEFNNVVIRNGQIVSGTALYYSAAPAAGNLVASIAAAAGTDAFGNSYLAGVVAYNPGSGLAQELGPNSFNLLTGAAGGGGPWTIHGFIDLVGGNLVIGGASASGTSIFISPDTAQPVTISGTPTIIQSGIQVTAGTNDRT